MLRKLSLAALMLCSLGAVITPLPASAQSGYYGDGSYGYRDNRDWNRAQRRAWRDRERYRRHEEQRLRREWRARQRWERGRYHGYNRRYRPNSFYFGYRY